MSVDGKLDAPPPAVNLRGVGSRIFADRRSRTDRTAYANGGTGLNIKLFRRSAVTAVILTAVLFCSAGYIAYLNGGSLDLSDTEVRIVVSGSMDGRVKTNTDYRSR